MAATVKARARGLLKGARELLGEKALPKEVRTALETLESSLKRTWADLESEAAEAEPDLEHEDTKTTKDAKHEDATDAAETPVQEAQGAHVGAPLQDAQGEDTGGTGLTAPLREARNVGQWFEAEIHRNFTMIADGQFGEGQLTRDERISLSSAIGDALDAFARKLSQAAPQLYKRDPYQQTVQEAGAADSHAAGTAPLRGQIVPLIERALRQDGTTKVKVIEAGWGTSGFYSPEVLKRDGPQAFRAGTHMFVDHPTVSDELERPERSLKELGGVLVTDARWEDDAAGGPGLYADAKVFSGFGAVLEEMAPHIGVSINADGVVREGAAEGRKGRIVERIRQAKSVDFVTQAGAGGKVMALYEARRLGGTVGALDTVDAAARSGQVTASATNGTLNTGLEEAGGMNEEELKALREAKAAADEQVARLQEALLLREARDVAAAELAKIEMPEPTRNRLLEAQVKRPVVKDGKLDTEAYATQVREAATAELAYLVEATGAGRIVGMGGSSEAAASPEQVEQRLNEAFRELGLSDSLAERAAKGR